MNSKHIEEFKWFDNRLISSMAAVDRGLGTEGDESVIARNWILRARRLFTGVITDVGIYDMRLHWMKAEQI